MKNTPNSWQQFITTAQKQCSVIAFQNWLEPIVLISCSEEKIELKIPNIYVKEYLFEHFSTLMSQFFSLELLSFTIDTQKPIVQSEQSLEKRSSQTLNLHPGYRFEHFIEGTDNQFVKSCAQNVAKNPMHSYNPFFIYGDAGLGKTHLLQSIAHELKASKRNWKIQCVTMETFITQLVQHLKDRCMQKMKNLYRNLDALLIDDIQFLEKRPNFSEEFCNTIEHLISQNKQICIVSDKPPNQLQIDSRITNRFEMGLSCPVVMPSYETKVAILTHKLLRASVALPSELICYIATKPFTNVRQIEGVVYRLKAYLSLDYVITSEAQIDHLLYDLLPIKKTKPIQLEQIVSTVASYFGLDKKQMLGSSRLQNIALARQCAIYLCKQLCNLPLTQIAQFFGKTHSTLLHSYKNIEKKAHREPSFQHQLEKLTMSLRQ